MKKKFTGSILSALFVAGQCAGADITPLLEKVAQNSHRLKALEYQQQAAVHRIDQAKAAYKPQVSFSLMYGWDKFRPYYSSRDIEQTLSYYYLSVSQAVYNPQALARIRQSKEYKELADLKVKQQEVAVKYVFLDSLVNYTVSKQLVEVYRELVGVLQEKVELLQTLYVSKRVGAEEVAKAQADLLAARTDLNQVMARMEAAKQVVENMLGGQIDRQVEDLELNPDVDSLFVPFEVWRQKLENSYDVRIAKKNIDIAKREVEVRKAAGYPRVSVMGSYLKSNTTSVSVAKEDTRVVASLEYPVYQGGGVEASVLEAQKLVMAANEEYLEVMRNREDELVRAFAVYAEAYRSIRELDEGLKQKAEVLKAAQEGFAAGMVTRLNVLDAKAGYLYYRVRYLNRNGDFFGSFLKAGFVVSENPEGLRVFK